MQEEYRRFVELFAEKVRAELQDRITSMALYGSVARGTARPDSDVDFLLIGESLSPHYHERLDTVLPIINLVEASEARRELERKGYVPTIRVVIYDKEEARDTKPIFLDLVEDAVILFDDGFLQAKLDQIQRRMRELGSRRVRLPDGGWYWDLKPDLKPGEVFEI
ncbi:MAG: nucleotidyltransferase domain-containing protein [Candidatus Methylomirabilales bacterium]